MSEAIEPYADFAASVIEVIGIVIITLFAIYAVVDWLVGMARQQRSEDLFHRVRQRLGRGILLGLEFLVASDIVHTVAVELTFETVGVLAVVVLIRTFLSFTLNVEITGKWPWQEAPNSTS